MEVLLITLLSVVVFTNCVMLGLLCWKLFYKSAERRSEAAVEKAMEEEKVRQDLIDEGIQEILSYKPSSVKSASAFDI